MCLDGSFLLDYKTDLIAWSLKGNDKDVSSCLKNRGDSEHSGEEDETDGSQHERGGFPG